MKGNSDLLVNSLENSYLLDDGLLSKKENEKSLIESPEDQPKRLKNYNFLNYFWNKLIIKPQSFPHKQNACIDSILPEDIALLASGIIRSVLSKKLELPLNSVKLSIATEDSFKIFHEDYPCDFILEYKGERLGMIILDNCNNSNNEAKLIYRFNPHIKSFRGF